MDTDNSVPSEMVSSYPPEAPSLFSGTVATLENVESQLDVKGHSQIGS